VQACKQARHTHKQGDRAKKNEKKKNLNTMMTAMMAMIMMLPETITIMMMTIT
jgi:hypothetical protein